MTYSTRQMNMIEDYDSDFDSDCDSDYDSDYDNDLGEDGCQETIKHNDNLMEKDICDVMEVNRLLEKDMATKYEHDNRLIKYDDELIEEKLIEQSTKLLPSVEEQMLSYLKYISEETKKNHINGLKLKRDMLSNHINKHVKLQKSISDLYEEKCERNMCIRILYRWKLSFAPLTPTPRKIYMLKPLKSTTKPFTLEWDKMNKRKNFCKDIRMFAESHAKSIIYKYKQKMEAINRKKQFHKDGKARAKKRRGMNQKTNWHKNRQNGGLALNGNKTVVELKEIHDRKQVKKANKQKELKIWETKNTLHQNNIKTQINKDFNYDISGYFVDDELVIDVDEDEVMALKNMNKICLETSSEREIKDAKDIKIKEHEINIKQQIHDNKKLESDTWNYVGKRGRISHISQLKTLNIKKPIDITHLQYHPLESSIHQNNLSPLE